MLYIYGRVQWWKFVMDETRSVESITNFTLEESMNIFMMQLNNALKDFDTFFSRVHSTSPPFRTVKCRGHWTDHNHFRGSITRFDYGQFHMNTCSYGSWAFSCMINLALCHSSCIRLGNCVFIVFLSKLCHIYADMTNTENICFHINCALLNPEMVEQSMDTASQKQPFQAPWLVLAAFLGVTHRHDG